MKRLLVLIMILGCVASASAQTLTRKGAYFVDGQLVLSQPESTLAVAIETETVCFTPGEFARYAQKYLGVRASLAAKTSTSIVAAYIAPSLETKAAECNVTANDNGSPLPIYRSSNEAMSAEQQAAKAAELIFSLRKQRRDLIAGDVGENVFGAGLKAALDEIARIESECLKLFYGTTTTTRNYYHYDINLSSGDKTNILCRFRAEDGVLPLTDLSGEAVALYITPSEVDLSSVKPATVKDKVVWEYAVAAPCKCVLRCGNRPLAETTLPLYQFGKTITVAAPIK